MVGGRRQDLLGRLEARPAGQAVAIVAGRVLVVATPNGRYLPGGASDAVLRAAGHCIRRRRAWPAGLTAHEVEVLRLVTRGLSNREIAERLTITRKTADNHVEHVYAKTGAANRAQAALFAMKHGLMHDLVPPECA